MQSRAQAIVVTAFLPLAVNRVRRPSFFSAVLAIHPLLAVLPRPRPLRASPLRQPAIARLVSASLCAVIDPDRRRAAPVPPPLAAGRRRLLIASPLVIAPAGPRARAGLCPRRSELPRVRPLAARRRPAGGRLVAVRRRRRRRSGRGDGLVPRAGHDRAVHGRRQGGTRSRGRPQRGLRAEWRWAALVLRWSPLAAVQKLKLTPLRTRHPRHRVRGRVPL